MGRPLIDISGQRYGIMTVLRIDDGSERGAHKSVRWVVKCDCGREKSISGHALRVLGQQSCGCLSGGAGKFKSKYGLPKSVIHRWGAMMARCYTPRTPRDSKNYMQRGIFVCDEWHDPRKYYADMGDPPFPGASIDRIDNNGPYSKENCRWATASQQNKNRRPFTRRRMTLVPQAHTTT